MNPLLSRLCRVVCSALLIWLWSESLASGQPSPDPASTNSITPPVGPFEKGAIDLAAIPFKIVHETFRETDGVQNWEIQLINADGSNPVNLTRTPGVDELYPHASPDGTKLCFVAEEKRGNRRVRDLYWMNMDGTGRVRIAENAREGCWSPDGKEIAFTRGEYEKYSGRPFASKGLFYYDIATGHIRVHPNPALHHLYNVCWSPAGKWLVASVTGGMGFSHSIIAFEADGTAVVDLQKYGIDGCRPDLGPDGRMITYGKADSDLYVAEVDLSMAVPRVGEIRSVVKCGAGYYVSHTDLSPDGRYIAFAYGPEVDYSVGNKAPGWNICVADLTGKWVLVTTDGAHNKEPDWVTVRK
jgi:Tol biopolymer transport system component